LASSSTIVSGRVNPTEYDNRWLVIQFSSSWVHPAESIRIRILRPGRVPGRCPGSWRSASRMTVM
jgi:hypothetical protein